MSGDVFNDVYRLIKSGDFESAVRLLYNHETRRIRSPYDVDLNHAWYVLGDIFFLERDFDFAISCFRKALRHWPDDYEAMWAMANSYSEAKMPDKALVWYRKALKYTSKNESLLYDYGNALYDVGEYKSAIDVYRKIPKGSGVYEFASKNMRLARRMLST